MFWKSEFSQQIIDYVRFAGIGINRIVDYTDLATLVIIPISYKYLQIQLQQQVKIHRVFTVPISVISLFAILATTLPRAQIELNLPIDKTYELQVSKSDFFKSLQAWHPYSDSLSKNLTDSLFYLSFDLSDYPADVTVISTVSSSNKKTTLIRLDTILSVSLTGRLLGGVDEKDKENIRQITPKQFETYFEEKFLEPIKNRRVEYLYYDNKEIRDSYNTN